MPDYNEMSKEQLQDEAEHRGLAKTGNKNDLVARLELNDAEDADSGGTIRGGGGLDAQATSEEGGAVTAIQPPTDDPANAAQAGGEGEPPAEESVPAGTAPPTSFGGQSSAGRPVQSDPERQDESIRGVVTNERGEVLQS